MSEVTPRDVLDGVLLSDGGLKFRGLNAMLEISQSGTDHYDWLEHIRDRCLNPLDIPSRLKLYKGYSRGQQYVYWCLTSRVSTILTNQYYRWYPDTVKLLPRDLVLTPVVVAHWFMGDGTSSYRGEKYPCLVRANFATHAFARNSLWFLIAQLHNFGIKASLPSDGCIWITGQESINKLMDMIEPYIVESFRYKIKRGRR